MSNFTFLQAEWPLLHESAVKAEALVHADARAACFYARRTLELAVALLFPSRRREGLGVGLRHKAAHSNRAIPPVQSNCATPQLPPSACFGLCYQVPNAAGNLAGRSRSDSSSLILYVANNG